MESKRKKTALASLHFPSIPLTRANRRSGKHYKIVSDVLSDLAKLDSYSAVKIDLAAVGKKKANLRAALHRAAKQKKVDLATSSDEKHLYVFHSSPKLQQRSDNQE